MKYSVVKLVESTVDVGLESLHEEHSAHRLHRRWPVLHVVDGILAGRTLALASRHHVVPQVLHGQRIGRLFKLLTPLHLLNQKVRGHLGV